jgi:hypothetical protein
MKIKDFDELVLIVQVQVGKFRIRNVGQRIWCEYYLKKFEKETWVEETSTSSICCENG